MYLFFDTETNGLPKNYKAPATDTANWPRIVQLAWVLCDDDGNEHARHNMIVKPDGWSIPDGMVHGITQERAERDGVLIACALGMFVESVSNAKTIVGHNLDFDSKVLLAEMIRADIQASLTRPTICTMKNTVNFCQLPGKYGYKWPTLQELHQKLFGVGFDGAHDAMADVLATKKCFFELRKRNVL